MNVENLIRIDYRQCAKSILRNSGMILLCALLCALLGTVAAIFAVDEEDLYDAQSTVFSLPSGNYGIAPASVQYAEVAKSLRVAQRAAKSLGDSVSDNGELSKMISVDAEYADTPYARNSSVIAIHARSANPDEAVRVCNAMSKAFVEEIAAMTGKRDLQQLDEATTTQKVYDAKRQQLLVIAGSAIAGLLFAAFYFFLRAIFSLRLNTVADSTLDGQLSVIGVIPLFSRKLQKIR